MAENQYQYGVVREEVSRLLAASIPDTSQRLEAVEWLFQSDPRAPYGLALQRLTGSVAPPETAEKTWRLALELQHSWSSRLREPVTLKAAATEAMGRCQAQEALGEGLSAPAPSLRSYLNRDLLTGLYHHTHYELSLASAIQEARQLAQPVSLLLIDLDGINELNRSQGHAAVDEIFRSFGEVIRHRFRPQDVPCRIGGDEFAVILPATPVGKARSLAEDLALALPELQADPVLTASMGLAAYPDEAGSAAELQEAAVDALQQARSRGGNAIETYFYDRSNPRARPGARAQKRKLHPGVRFGLAAGVVLIIAGTGMQFLHHQCSVMAGTPAASGSRATVSTIPIRAASLTAFVPLPGSSAGSSLPTRGMAPPHGDPPSVALAAMPAAGRPSASPGGDPLLEAARPRLSGDYSLAARQLGQLAGAAVDPTQKVKALIAEACAQAAAGESPLDTFHAAGAVSRSVPMSARVNLVGMARLARARWFIRRGEYGQSEPDLEAALWGSTDRSLKRDAAAGLIQQFRLQSQPGRAWNLANGLAGQQSDPAVRAALRMLAADTMSQGQQAVKAFEAQPAALLVSGDLQQAASAALAHTLVPGWNFNRSQWLANSRFLFRPGLLARESVVPLRLALAEQLLQIGDASDAHNLLQPCLSGRAGAPETASGPQQDHARVLEGLALWKMGSPAGARAQWRLVVEEKPGPVVPAVWTPAPDEQWWPKTASLLLGQEAPGDYTGLMNREGLPNSRAGKVYLQQARWTG